MNRKTLLSSAAALLIAGSASFAMAQTSTPPAAAAPAASAHWAKPAGVPMHSMHMRHGAHRGSRHGMRGIHGHAFGPGGAVIADLHQIDRLYTMQGKSGEMEALYKDVLSRTQNRQVRNYIYAHLAREQLRPAHPSVAIATLRKSLDENLTALNKHQDARLKHMKD